MNRRKRKKSRAQIVHQRPAKRTGDVSLEPLTKVQLRQYRDLCYTAMLKALQRKPVNSFNEVLTLTGLTSNMVTRICKRSNIPVQSLYILQEPLKNYLHWSKRFQTILFYAPEAVTYTQIAQRLQLSRERVRQIVVKLGFKEEFDRYLKMKKRLRTLKVLQKPGFKELFINSDTMTDVAGQLKMAIGELQTVLIEVAQDERIKSLIELYMGKPLKLTNEASMGKNNPEQLPMGINDHATKAIKS